MRLSSYLPAVVALACAAVLAIISAILAADRIEQGSHRQISRVLLADGQTWTDVVVDGLQVTLSGTAPDEATRFRSLRLAGTVVDAARVIDRMYVTPGDAIEPPRFSIEILRNDAGISLIGLVPSAMDRAAVAATIAELAGGAVASAGAAQSRLSCGWPGREIGSRCGPQNHGLVCMTSS